MSGEVGLDGGRKGFLEGPRVWWEGSSPCLRVDLRLFYLQLSADSHLLEENKVNRSPL